VPTQDQYTRARESLGIANPVEWNFVNVKTKERRDGPELVAELVAEDSFNWENGGGVEVEFKVVRTEDGRYRRLTFWPPNDGEEHPEYGLVEQWRKAKPEVGDFASILQTIRTSESGNDYAVYAVVVTKPEAANESESDGIDWDDPDKRPY
jgi:hypothetical protein